MGIAHGGRLLVVAVECGGCEFWQDDDKGPAPEARARMSAKRHAKATGHVVDVVLSRQWRYGPSGRIEQAVDSQAHTRQEAP